jgi:hypothetical protein
MGALGFRLSSLLRRLDLQTQKHPLRVAHTGYPRAKVLRNEGLVIHNDISIADMGQKCKLPSRNELFEYHVAVLLGSEIFLKNVLDFVGSGGEGIGFQLSGPKNYPTSASVAWQRSGRWGSLRNDYFVSRCYSI